MVLGSYSAGGTYPLASPTPFYPGKNPGEQRTVAIFGATLKATRLLGHDTQILYWLTSEYCR